MEPTENPAVDLVTRVRRFVFFARRLMHVKIHLGLEQRQFGIPLQCNISHCRFFKPRHLHAIRCNKEKGVCQFPSCEIMRAVPDHLLNCADRECVFCVAARNQLESPYLTLLQVNPLIREELERRLIPKPG